MASWYDCFWKSYTEGTLRKPLEVVLREVAVDEPTSNPARRPPCIVDVGCGTGEFLRRLRDDWPSYADSHHDETIVPSPQLIGVEPSREMLEQARKKFDVDKEGAMSSISSVTLEESPAEYLPLDDGVASVVVSTNAFHFFRDKDRALSEMKRVLQDAGTLVIADWCNDYWIVKLYHFLEKLRWNWRFEERYPSPLTSLESMELVKAAGFDEVEIDTYRVRVFAIFFWGMQMIKAKKR